MKNLLFISILIPILGFSQVPSYYANVNLNLSGTALKNELANKVTNTHTNFLSYTPGVWNALKQTDLSPSNSSKVLLVYGYSDTDGDFTTDRTRGINDNGGGSGDWNREHVYPKSLGNPNLGTSGPGADAHHLRPSDVQRNSSRGSRKFGDGTGNSGATSQGYWYPGDDWKGDVARMMMYMYIRYGNRCLPKNVGVGVTNANDSNMLNLFLKWNVEDPVSTLELQRNPVLENLQGNRNPFIDNPAFATQIWGGPQAEDRFDTIGGNDILAPTAPSNLTASNTTQVSTVLSWSASTDNVGVTGYEIYRNGNLISTITTTNYTVLGLLPGSTYSFFVKAKDAAANVSAAGNTISVITQTNTTGGNATALFFSEYVEGSSNNKVLEIANFTGGSINLSNYSVKRQTNGSGSWSSAVNLSGTVTNNEVFVIANSSASSVVKNEADLVSAASTMTFNGNDPVGLFKNGVLIDIIGTFNGGSSNFAKDITLRRKENVKSPTITYNSSEWESYSQNTFNGLGMHTFNGTDTTGTDTQAPSAPTSLSASNSTQNSVQLSWEAAVDNIGVIGYHLYQENTLIVTTTNTQFNATGLLSGSTYSFKVYAYDAAGNVSSSSNSTTVTTTSTTTVTYCSSGGNTIDFEYIDYVSLSGISNATVANDGYGDFTSQVATISKGMNTITVSAGFASASYEEKWSAWIDFNQNGIFETSEKIVNASSSSSANLTYDFIVPLTAKYGSTRMRISMKWNGIPSSCETFGYGEVEDYTVNIVALPTKAEGKSSVKELKKYKEKDFSITIHPNPAATYIRVDIEGDYATFRPSFILTNMRGEIVRSGKISHNIISLDGLLSGVYVVRVTGDNQNILEEKVMINN